MGISRTCPRCGATLTSNGAWCANCMGSGTWKCQKCGHTHTPSTAMRCYGPDAAGRAPHDVRIVPPTQRLDRLADRERLTVRLGLAP